MTTPPYIDKELEDLHSRIKKGTEFMMDLKKDDPNYATYLDRFFALVKYYVDNTTPLAGMRIVIDDRSDKLPFQERPLS